MVSCAILLAIIAAAAASPIAQDDIASRIKHVVVLVLENRSFDNFCGDFDYDPNIDGLRHTKFCNPVNVSIVDSQQICAEAIEPDVTPDDPNHSITGNNLELYGTYHPTDASKEIMDGFLTEQERVFHPANITRARKAIDYYASSHMRVFEAMAQNFVLFDRWFCSVPGPTNPNRAYLTAGTSHGHGRNDGDFDTSSINIRSVFQALSEKDVSWINYSNTTGFLPDALFYTWTVTSGTGKTNVKPIAHFYDDAKAGKLPQFTYINPECCSFDSFHPPSPITIGSDFIKGVYKALRSSPQWENTLFILTFDENGGFGDHVPPPTNVPAGDSITYTETAADGKNYTFAFDRLGVRVPTLLISPWVPKGKVEKKGNNNGGEYSHTSIIAFLNKLWDINLHTPRVDFSSTFEHLILNKPRDDDDVVKTLPDAFPF